MRSTISSRRTFTLTSASMLATVATIQSVKAAEFQYKYGNVQQDALPLNTRVREMWDAVRAETNGRLDVQVFSHGVLGSDTSALQQLRVGAIQFYHTAGGLIAETVPVAGIESTPFAFKTPTAAFPIFDGDLGRYVQKEVIAKGIYMFPNVWDGGFRVVTTSTRPIKAAEDLTGLKIRVPESHLWVDLFRALGASPTPVSIPQVYSALQTHIVDGYEGSKPAIYETKIYEVQKYLSLTNHMWWGNWFLGNMDAWNALPPDIRTVVSKNAVKYCGLQRRQSVALDAVLALKLQQAGLAVNDVDRPSFNRLLGPSFYTKMKSGFGSTAWTLLEKSVGNLG